MTIFRFSAAIAALAAAASAAPQSSPQGAPIHRFVRVADLRLLCGGEHNEMCSGYVMAVVDTANSVRVADSKPEVVCPPNGVGDEQLVTIVQANLKKNDAPDEYGAPTAILGWLGKEYPCK
jgi:hypothetical protein